ncbi:FAD-dependent oxidoreductase [Pseudochelatococcus lubricantis]|uniref:FAD-dependent oxidoreductase n=1 Tax=Pseudochelatococcus lubricantis TaxID=1538102 RepID=UPI0035EDE53A
MTIRTGYPRDGIHDVCVVGSGPAGLAAAIHCAELGLSVVVVEAGGMLPQDGASLPPYGEVVDPARHAPLDVAVCRALGGNSWWWGGCCMPLDPIDFAPRDFVADSGWPIDEEDIAPYYEKTAAFLDCGHLVFSSPAVAFQALDDSGDVTFSRLERWARTRAAPKRHGAFLRDAAAITVCLGTTAIAIEQEDGHARIRVRDAGGEAAVNARFHVLAGGGLGSTKLLLEYRRRHPPAFGGGEGALGHYYMGHVHGSIADIVFDRPELAESADFFLDDATWVRRRLAITPQAQIAHEILNTSFWVDNPPFHDHRHRSGILSAVFLALSFPAIGRLLVSEGIRRVHIGTNRNYAAHLANVILNPFSTVAAAWQILRQRYIDKPRRPGFLIRNKAGRYALTFHAEQMPQRASTVLLADDAADGALRIDLRFCPADAVSIVRAYDLVDRSLRGAGIGRLEYHVPAEEREAAVLGQLTDGYHQEGLMRMGDAPATSVVDGNCKVHGFSNLYVASTGVMTTSSQANPTFTACALAIRLAHHLAEPGARETGARDSSGVAAPTSV